MTLWTAVGDQIAGLITTLGTNTEVQQYAAVTVSEFVTALLGDIPIASVVGDAVGAAVAGLLATPGVASVGAVIGGLIQNLLGQPGLVAVVAAAAGPAVSAVVAGEDLTTVIDALITTLRASTVVQDDLGAFTAETVTALLGDTTLWAAVGKQLAELVDTIASNPDVQTYAGEFAAQFVTEALSSFPPDFAVAIGTAIGDAVTSLLGIPAFTAGLGAVVGIVIPTLLEQPGLIGAVATAAGQLVTGVVAGADLTDALGEAITALETDPVVLSAISATISAALSVVEFVILDDPASSRGSVRSSPPSPTRSWTARRSWPTSSKHCEPLAGFATALLTDTAFTGRVAGNTRRDGDQFPGLPGFNSALIAALNQAIDEVLFGADVSTAVANALASLQADPDFQAAVYGVVPVTVAMLLGDPAVRRAISSALPILVSAILKDAGITSGLIDALAGRIAAQATAYLLAQVPVWGAGRHGGRRPHPRQDRAHLRRHHRAGSGATAHASGAPDRCRHGVGGRNRPQDLR